MAEWIISPICHHAAKNHFVNVAAAELVLTEELSGVLRRLGWLKPAFGTLGWQPPNPSCEVSENGFRPLLKTGRPGSVKWKHAGADQPESQLILRNVQLNPANHWQALDQYRR